MKLMVNTPRRYPQLNDSLHNLHYPGITILYDESKVIDTDYLCDIPAGELV